MFVYISLYCESINLKLLDFLPNVDNKLIVGKELITHIQKELITYVQKELITHIKNNRLLTFKKN